MLRLAVIEETVLAWSRGRDAEESDGGSVGVIFPGGTFLGLPYAQLVKLGSGLHAVELDETAEWEAGQSPLGEPEDDRLFRAARFELFKHEHCGCLVGEPFCTLLEAMTPGNSERLLPLLPDDFVAEFHTYARQIAPTPEERARKHRLIDIYTGKNESIPEANLLEIRRLFGQPAEPTAAAIRGHITVFRVLTHPAAPTVERGVRRRRRRVEFSEAVRQLLSESECHRLVEQAFAEFDRWVDFQEGAVGGVPRAALEVTFWEQSVVLRTEVPPTRPHVATTLRFKVREDDDGLSGRYQLLTGPAGAVIGERVDLDGAVPFESLGPGAWVFCPGHHGYCGPIPRCSMGDDDGLPF